MSDSSKQPLVSAIIIFFNVEKYLEEAIESVRAQTYENWELLLCDDGSKDKSTQIAKDYANRYPDKIRYLEHEGHANRGMSATRNLGIRNARGEYISWLDSDDVWLSRKLAEQVRILEAHPECAMVYNPLRFWYSWSGLREDFHRDFNQRLPVPAETVIQPPNLIEFFLKDEHFIPSSVLVRTDVLREVGGYEESFRDEYEDVMAHSKVCIDRPVIAAGESFYKYRQHEGSCCAETRRTGRQRSRYLIYLKKLQAFLESKGHTKGSLWDELQSQFQPFLEEKKFARAEKWAKVQRKVDYVVTETKAAAKLGARRVFPRRLYSWLKSKSRGQGHWPPVGGVNFGDLRRVTPINADGEARGLSVARYYVERFLSQRSNDIQGQVLTDHAEWVTPFASHKLIALHSLSKAKLDELADSSIDSAVIVNSGDQLDALLPELNRVLKPGGTLLLVAPAGNKLASGLFGRSTVSAKARLLNDFEGTHLSIEGVGNVLSMTAALYGLSAEDLEIAQLDHHDPDNQLFFTIRAERAALNSAIDRRTASLPELELENAR